MENASDPQPENEQPYLGDLANLPIHQRIDEYIKRHGLTPRPKPDELTLGDRIRMLPREEGLKLLKEHFENSPTPESKELAQDPVSLSAMYGSIYTYESDI